MKLPSHYLKEKDSLLQKAYNGILYRYRHLTERSSEGNELIHPYTLSIVRDSQLYFSTPVQFNDPFDIRPSIAKPSRQSLKRALNINRTPKDRKQKILYGMDAQEMVIKSGRGEKVIEKHRNVIRLCCFSKSCTNIQQWAYYGQSHQGICFGFDSKKDQEAFALPLPVNYPPDNRRPQMIPFSRDSNVDFFFTKANSWRHEQEVRCIRPYSKEHFVRFDPKSLIEVIFGYNADEEIMNNFKSILEEGGFGHVKLKKIEIDDQKYQLHSNNM